MPRVILAPSLELANAYMAVAHIFKALPTITVEAEYGGHVIEGSIGTFAEHQASGPYAQNIAPAPCNNPRIPVINHSDVILVSHYDLDTAGGCLRAFSQFQSLFTEDTQEFWRLAAFIDSNGAHKLHAAACKPETKEALRAFWAWSKNTIPRLPWDRIIDITAEVVATGDALRAILQHSDPLMIQAGRELQRAEDDLNKSSLVQVASDGSVILRESSAFVNHLYNYDDNKIANAVVAYNHKSGAITISLESAIEGVSCRDIVQRLWGSEAGGKDVIAGSPRGKAMGGQDVHNAFQAVVEALKIQPARRR